MDFHWQATSNCRRCLDPHFSCASSQPSPGASQPKPLPGVEAFFLPVTTVGRAEVFWRCACFCRIFSSARSSCAWTSCRIIFFPSLKTNGLENCFPSQIPNKKRIFHQRFQPTCRQQPRALALAGDSKSPGPCSCLYHSKPAHPVQSSFLTDCGCWSLQLRLQLWLSPLAVHLHFMDFEDFPKHGTTKRSQPLLSWPQRLVSGHKGPCGVLLTRDLDDAVAYNGWNSPRPNQSLCLQDPHEESRLWSSSSTPKKNSNNFMPKSKDFFCQATAPRTSSLDLALKTPGSQSTHLILETNFKHIVPDDFAMTFDFYILLLLKGLTFFMVFDLFVADCFHENVQDTGGCHELGIHRLAQHGTPPISKVGSKRLWSSGLQRAPPILPNQDKNILVIQTSPKIQIPIVLLLRPQKKRSMRPNISFSVLRTLAEAIQSPLVSPGSSSMTSPKRFSGKNIFGSKMYQNVIFLIAHLFFQKLMLKYVLKMDETLANYSFDS